LVHFEPKTETKHRTPFSFAYKTYEYTVPGTLFTQYVQCSACRCIILKASSNSRTNTVRYSTYRGTRYSTVHAGVLGYTILRASSARLGHSHRASTLFELVLHVYLSGSACCPVLQLPCILQCDIPNLRNGTHVGMLL
jgi:hypothetical protein